MPAVSVLVVLSLLAVGSPATAAAGDGSGYAPIDRPGPELSVPIAELEAAYQCHGDFSSPLEPVLYVPGTGVTVEQSFSWNYANVFDAERRPYCTIAPPFRTQGDIQIAGEYIVYAIRQTYVRAGQPIAVLGASQGGMSPRWALRFWPDTRAMVEDQIAMAGSNHGTGGSHCTPKTPCTEAMWQQEPTSAFLAALNSPYETFAGIDYTSIYTLDDKTVYPTSGPDASSPLRTGDGTITNVAIQSICESARSDHLTVGTLNAITYALVMDALNHDGPADPARIDPAVCAKTLMPGITLDPEILNVVVLVLQTVIASLPGNLGGDPVVASEPALRCYAVESGCAPEGATPDPIAGDVTAPESPEAPPPAEQSAPPASLTDAVAQLLRGIPVRGTGR